MKKKKSLLIATALMLIVSASSTVLASEANESELNAYSSIETQIEGVEYDDSNTRNLGSNTKRESTDTLIANRAVGVCLDYLEVDKKWFSNKWRALGETSISGGVSWDIAMELELWKDGHVSTTVSKKSNNTSYYSTGTKFVSGNNEDQFGAEGIFRVFDDNNVKIHEQELYVNR